MAVLSKRAEASERRRETEAAFVAATEALLALGSSYADLSVEQISAAAGRSRTAFYVYFRDKRELLMRATETVAAQLYDEADRWWSGVGRFIEATERRLADEGDEPTRAAGKSFALVWMTERACYQQVARGGRMDDPKLVDALLEVWERSVYGPG